MNKEALLRLADKLDGSGAYAKVGPVPEEHFDMRYFWKVPGNIRVDFAEWAKLTAYGTRPGCGTAACALGWAAADPYFRRLGLHDTTGSMFDKAATMFDIKYSEATTLFTPDDEEHGLNERDTPQAVAERLRRFVRDREATAA